MRTNDLVEGGAVEAAPDRDGEPAAGGEDAPHLPHTALAVVEEHHGELADDGVEAPGGEGKVEGAAPDPRYGGC